MAALYFKLACWGFLRLNTKSTKVSTWIGSGALVLWIVEPLLVAELEGFPLFESLALIFSSCFVITAMRISILRKWHLVRQQPLFVWFFGIVAICGSDFCYILGAYSAPIAHIDLIDYMWPCFIVFFIGFLPQQKFSFKFLIGVFLGFIGILQLIYYDGGMSGFNQDYLLGYGLEFFGVIIWGAYYTYSSYKPEVPTFMIGIYCGVAAIICLALHLRCETTVIPSLGQGSMTVILGLVGPGLAYQLWDHGMKFGDPRLLSVCCYIARVISMALLVWFAKQPFSSALVIACVLAIAGVFISSVDERWLKAILVGRFKPRVATKPLVEGSQLV